MRRTIGAIVVLSALAAVVIGAGANELAAAKLVRYEEFNPQSQPKIVWPAAMPVVRSYLDQLVRNDGLSAARTTAISNALASAERRTGAARATWLSTLAKQVHADANGAKDPARVRAMAAAIAGIAGVAPVVIDDPECAEVSFPGFYRMLAQAAGA